MHSLSDSTQGYTYTIKWMFGLPEVMKSMHDMDIHEGSTIRVLRKFHYTCILSATSFPRTIFRFAEEIIRESWNLRRTRIVLPS